MLSSLQSFSKAYFPEFENTIDYIMKNIFVAWSTFHGSGEPWTIFKHPFFIPLKVIHTDYLRGVEKSQSQIGHSKFRVSSRL